MHDKDMACRTWPRIISQSQIFNYGRSIFLCHLRPKHFRFLWFMPSLGVRSLCIDSYAAVALEITSYPGLSQTGGGGHLPSQFLATQPVGPDYARPSRFSHLTTALMCVHKCLAVEQTNRQTENNFLVTFYEIIDAPRKCGGCINSQM